MSITTKTGDYGETRLLFNRVVAKTHARVTTYGAIDELTCAIGLARATLARTTIISETLRWSQDCLLKLAAELATDDEDQDRLIPSGITLVSDDDLAKIHGAASELESRLPRLTRFIIPGDSCYSASMHCARTICRRAELQIWALKGKGHVVRDILPQFLNRLSDYLWLAARAVDELNDLSK